MTRRAIPAERLASEAAVTAIALSLWLFAACGEPSPKREWLPSDHGQPSAGPGPTQDDSAPSGTEEVAPAEARARAARALWAVSCAGCHGRDGRGHGDSIPPGAQLPDFTSASFQSSRTDEQLAQAIHDGKGMMPPFAKKVSDEGIAALVGHVRAFAAPQAAQDVGEGSTPTGP